VKPENLQPDLSIVIPISERYDEVRELYKEYKRGLASLEHLKYEFIFVLDGPRHDCADGLKKLLSSGESITVISLTRPFGESTALTTGFDHAKGNIVLTLPGYFQVQAEAIPQLIESLNRHDMVCARRHPRVANFLDRARRLFFHKLLRLVCRHKFSDLGCGVRAMRRSVLDEITIYAEHFRFLPLLAYRHGFNVVEIDAPQSAHDKFRGRYPASDYLHRILDIFSLFFLIRFKKKPLRFFGIAGLSSTALGALLLSNLVYKSLFSNLELSQKPILLIASLLIVLGVQMIALGLLGELIVFTHGRAMKDYKIAEVINFKPQPSSARQ
jgi:glycosyltransferase involved in cell wall biosynthesis